MKDQKGEKKSVEIANKPLRQINAEPQDAQEPRQIQIGQNKGDLLVPVDPNRQPTNQELMQQVQALSQQVAALTLAQGGQEIQAVQEQAKEAKQRNVDKLMDELEKGYSESELQEAEQWVIRQMGGRCAVQAPQAAGGGAVPEIIFDRYVVTQADRDSGRTALPDGWTVTHTVPVYALARYYIKIILDKDSYQTDAEKLLAIVKVAEERGSKGTRRKKGSSLHPEFVHLFDDKGNLKPIKRRARRRQENRGG